MVEEPIHRTLRDRGDLVRVIEVRVQHDVLVHRATALDHTDERGEPSVVGQHLLRHDRGALAREPHAPHVRYGEQCVADRGHLIRAEVPAVAAADHDVLDLGAARDVREHAIPTRVRRLQTDLLHRFLVRPDGVRARAEPAIYRARVERQKEHLVRVTMREAGCGRVRLLRERVERELRMVGQARRRRRYELEADRIVVRVLPVDEAQEVRRDAHGHRREPKARTTVLDERLADDAAKGLEQLFGLGDRVLHLPAVIEKLRLADLGERGDASPEVAVDELAVRERAPRDLGSGVRKLLFHCGQLHSMTSRGRGIAPAPATRIYP